MLTAISRKVVGKRPHDKPERYCGWFLVHWSLKKFDKLAQESVDICLRMLKESDKSRFDSYSVRNSELIVSHTILPFGIVACTFFPTTVLEVAIYQSSLNVERGLKKDHVLDAFAQGLLHNQKENNAQRTNNSFDG